MQCCNSMLGPNLYWLWLCAWSSPFKAQSGAKPAKFWGNKIIAHAPPKCKICSCLFPHSQITKTEKLSNLLSQVTSCNIWSPHFLATRGLPNECATQPPHVQHWRSATVAHSQVPDEMARSCVPRVQNFLSTVIPGYPSRCFREAQQSNAPMSWTQHSRCAAPVDPGPRSTTDWRKRNLAGTDTCLSMFIT